MLAALPCTAAHGHLQPRSVQPVAYWPCNSAVLCQVAGLKSRRLIPAPSVCEPGGAFFRAKMLASSFCCAAEELASGYCRVALVTRRQQLDRAVPHDPGGVRNVSTTLIQPGSEFRLGV